MNGPHARHGLVRALEVADGDELHLGKVMIKTAQMLFVHVMHGVDELAVRHEAREHQRGHTVEMNDIAIFGRIADGPGGMIEVLQIVENLAPDRPLRFFVEPAGLDADRRLAIRIDDHIDILFLQSLSQLSDKEFRPSIGLWGYRQERRRYQSNSHVRSLWSEGLAIFRAIWRAYSIKSDAQIALISA